MDFQKNRYLFSEQSNYMSKSVLKEENVIRHALDHECGDTYKL